MTETATTRAVREVLPLHFACTVCDEVQPVKRSNLRVGQRAPIFVHGPRGDRCLGGNLPGKTWIASRRLPQWGGMTDLDRGAALMFVWKCHWERNYHYARENYPCTYRDHPDLVALSVRDACSHAGQVVKELTGRDGHVAINSYLGEDEFDRLYQLALHAKQDAS